MRFVEKFENLSEEVEEKMDEGKNNAQLSDKNFSDSFRFLKDLQQSFSSPLSTGFSSLDEGLDGGLYAGLYVIGAAPAMGKTSLALQIAYNVAKSGRDVFFFSAMEEEKTLFVKTTSRLMFEKCKSQKKMAFAKTTLEIQNHNKEFSKEETRLFQNAINECAKVWEHIHVIQNVPEGEWAPSINGDIFYEYKGRKLEGFRKKITSIDDHPLVVIDYIQNWASFCEMPTDTQNIKEFVIGLKMISLEYKIPVIALSAIANGKYHAPLDFDSFKGSSQIEISSDVLLGLQFYGWDFQDWESTEKRIWRVSDLQKRQTSKGNAGHAQLMELKMLKNRHGAIEQNVTLNFYPKYGCFRGRTTSEAE